MCNNNENDFFEPEMTIYHGSNCKNYEHEERRRRHDCGCCDGCCQPSTNQCCNICEQQMKYLVQQLIELYPDDTFVFTLQNGVQITGKPTTLTSAVNRGLVAVTLAGETPTTVYLNICKIAYISIAGAAYDSATQYMTQSNGVSCRGCEPSLTNLFEVGQNLIVTIAGDELATATVRAVAAGVVVLQTTTDLIFASTCSIDVFEAVHQGG